MIPCDQCGEKFYDVYDHIKHGSNWRCAQREIERLKTELKKVSDKLYQAETNLYWPEKGTC